MVSRIALYCLFSSLVVGQAWGNPMLVRILPQPAGAQDARALPLVSELGARLGAHSSRLQDARLPLPSPQDLEAIKKVAQILVTLGQQVIPAIIGEPATPTPCDAATIGAGVGLDIPNDPVNISDKRA